MEAKTEQEFISITPLAMGKIKEVIAQQTVENLFLRVYVQGGCGGIQYGMAIDSRLQDGDTEFKIDDLKVVVDRISYQYVENCTVDFEDQEKAGFRITNPNPEILASVGGGCASGSCGGGSCGSGGCC